VGAVFNFMILMLVPTGVTIYVINFARWMRRRGHHTGAVGAYLIAVLTFFIAAVIVFKSIS
jgi:hypothetical protein